MTNPAASDGLLGDLECRHEELLIELDQLNSRISEAINECQQLRKGTMGEESDTDLPS